MGDYKIWKCTNCQTTVLCNRGYSFGLVDFLIISDHISCCDHSDIRWAYVYVDGDDMIILPDNEEIPEPEFPRQSRIELVLEDVANG
jgi:hypothetical protein